MPTRPESESVAANVVHLVGRLSGIDEVRELPSGDHLLPFRIVVDRPAPRVRGAGRRPPSSDTIDCSVASAALRRALQRCAPGDHVEVSGRLQRRFWRTPAGTPSSRYEVVVDAVRKLRATMTA